jgi:hypothetical protein
MRLPRVRFTIRWFMTRIAVLAAAVAFLVAADREGRPNGCGTPLLSAMTVLLALATGYVITRIVIFGIRHPS